MTCTSTLTQMCRLAAAYISTLAHTLNTHIHILLHLIVLQPQLKWKFTNQDATGAAGQGNTDARYATIPLNFGLNREVSLVSGSV